MREIASSIQNFFGESQDLGAYLAAMAAIGVAAMALIQAAKDLLPLRRWFQYGRLRKWFEMGAREAEVRFAATMPGTDGAAVNPQRAWNDLIALSVDGDENALLNLSIEQLCGQMSAAFQVVLDYPRQYRDLLMIAGSFSAPLDMSEILNTDRSAIARGDGPPSAEQVRWADARNRVTHQLQRAVDGFQIATGYRWTFLMKIASFVVSGILAAVAVQTKGAGIGSHIGVILFTGILAGFLAPVARDLAATIQRLRGA
jgi:hypothetical protein